MARLKTLPLARQGLSAAAALCLLALLGARLWDAHAAAARPIGRYTAAQMLARARPLCRALAPPGAALRFQAQAVDTLQHGRLPQPLWQVQCTDEAGDDVASLIWDARDGQLLQLGRHLPAAPGRGRAVLSAARARRAAAEWLSVLRLGRDGPWQPAGAPVRIGESWHVGWRRRDPAGNIQPLTVQVDARTGDLVLVAAHAAPAR